MCEINKKLIIGKRFPKTVGRFFRMMTESENLSEFLSEHKQKKCRIICHLGHLNKYFCGLL